MRFLVDAQLPLALCRWLESRGHQAEHVFEIGLGAAGDGDISNHAIANHAVLVSKDEDFLILRMPDRFAFLWLRCGNTTKAALSEWLDARWSKVEELLAAGERLIELR